MKIGLDVPGAAWRTAWPRPAGVRDEVGLPCVLRPSFTMGGTGGGIAYNREEFDRIVATGSSSARSHEVLIEESR